MKKQDLVKITQKKMAEIANVTPRTIINWEKEKPELMKLLRDGLKSKTICIDFLKNFEHSIVWEKDIIYLDFYFRFLNHIRTDLELSKHKSIIDTDEYFFFYLLEKHKSEIFDQTLLGDSSINLRNLKISSHMHLITNQSYADTKYIYKNIQDGFKTLIEDVINIDTSRFEQSLLISITYLVYMFYPLENHKEKEKIKQSIFKNELQFEMILFITNDPIIQDSIEVIYQNYLKFRNTLFLNNVVKKG